MSYEPTKDDLGFLNQVDQGYVGLSKPRVEIIKIEDDKYLYRRYQASKELGIPPDQLEDEPDEMLDHSDDQGYDQFNEEER